MSLYWSRPIQAMTHPTFLKTHFNINLPSITSSSKRFLSVGSPHQNPVCTSSVSPTRYKHHTIHCLCSDHSNNFWWEMQIMEPVPSDRAVSGLSFAGTAGSNPTGGRKFVCWECCKVEVCSSGWPLAQSRELPSVWFAWVWPWGFGNKKVLVHQWP